MFGCVCENEPTLVTGNLLFDSSGHSSCGGLPEWVTPALSGPLGGQSRILAQTGKVETGQTGQYWCEDLKSE